MSNPEALAKLIWHNPAIASTHEYVLTEGATATIGRTPNNDIHIPEDHVSRQHAVIQHRNGMFMIHDLGSSNGTFVNEQRITDPFPLVAGDEIRLYVPVLKFLSLQEGDAEQAQQTGTMIVAAIPNGKASLTVANGIQEGQTIPLLLDEVRIGRMVSGANWEVLLQDASISRPHARIVRDDNTWTLFDLNSSNGTFVNKKRVPDRGAVLQDGDTLYIGGTNLLFRLGWEKDRPSYNLDLTIMD